MVNARNADEQVTHLKAGSPTDFQAPGQPDLNDPQSAERHIEEKAAFDETRGRATRVRIIFFCLQIACWKWFCHTFCFFDIRSRMSIIIMRMKSRKWSWSVVTNDYQVEELKHKSRKSNLGIVKTRKVDVSRSCRSGSSLSRNLESVVKSVVVCAEVRDVVVNNC